MAPSVAYRGDELYLEGEHTPEQLEVARAVGYHNYFRLGVHEASAFVQRKCPAGWRCFVGFTQAPPEGAIRVGQVLVHQGDPPYELYVYPFPWLSPAEVAQITGTAESTWRNRAAAGKIPDAVKVGKQWLLPRAVLRAQGVAV